jgi:hypothetical protein
VTAPEKARLPLRVNRVDLGVGGRLPVFPNQRTSSDRPGMSEKYQMRTHAPQQIALYSITSSASSKTDSEMVSPSA